MEQEYHVDKIIRCDVRENDLENRVYEFIAKQDYVPDDVIIEAKIIEHKFFYVPAHKYNIAYNATWTASFGYDREEHYTEYVNVTKYPSSGNSYTIKEPVNRTRTITDWRPASGKDKNSFFISTYAGQILHKSKLYPASLIPYVVSKGKAVNFDSSLLAGFKKENFWIDSDELINTLDDEIDDEISYNIKKHAQGNRQKDWHWNTNTSYNSESIYVPLCCTVFEYKGEQYKVWMDGIGCKEIVADKLPHDKGKDLSKIIGFIPMGIASASVVFTTMYWKFVWFGIGAIVVTWAYAILRNFLIKEHSKDVRNAVLKQIKENLNTKQNNKANTIIHPKKSVFARFHLDIIIISLMSLFVVYKIVTISYDEHVKVASLPVEPNNTSKGKEVKKQPKKELTHKKEKVEKKEVIKEIYETRQTEPREQLVNNETEQDKKTAEEIWSSETGEKN